MYTPPLTKHYLRILQEESLSQGNSTASESSDGPSVTSFIFLPLVIIVITVLLCCCVMMFICSYRSTREMQKSDFWHEILGHHRLHQVKPSHANDISSTSDDDEFMSTIQGSPMPAKQSTKHHDNR
jgi:hypothetical protein